MTLERDPDQDLAVLAKVQKLIADGNTELSLTELLDKAEVTEQEYIDALEVSTNGNVVVLKRECLLVNVSLNQLQSLSDASMASQHGHSVCAKCICLCDVCSLLYHENREVHG